MIGGACQGATPTSLPQPIGAALRPPWPSATIEGLAPYAGLYSLLTVSAAATQATTSTATVSVAAAPRSPPAPLPISPPGVPINTPVAAGVVATHAVLAQLHALCVQQKDGALAGALPPILPPGQMTLTPTMLESFPRPLLAINNNNNNNNNSSSSKSTFSAVTTVAASRCVTVSSRDDLRMSSVSNSGQTLLATPRATSKLSPKKAVTTNLTSTTHSGLPKVALKCNLNGAKDGKDITIGVLNTNTRTIYDQSLNCVVTSTASTTLAGSQLMTGPRPPPPSSCSDAGGSVRGAIGNSMEDSIALRNNSVSSSSMSTVPVNHDSRMVHTTHVPAHEKDTLKLIENHRTNTSLQVVGGKDLNHAKTSSSSSDINQGHDASNKTMISDTVVNCNGANGFTEKENPRSSNGTDFSCQTVEAKDEPETISNVVIQSHNNHVADQLPLPQESACDLSSPRSENREMINPIRIQAVQPVPLSNHSSSKTTTSVNKDEEQARICSGGERKICIEEQNYYHQQQEEPENLKVQSSDNDDSMTMNPLSAIIGDQCSRTTPGLHEAYVQGRKAKQRPKHLSVSGNGIGSCSSPAITTPISVGNSSPSCPPIVALTQLSVPRVAHPPTAAAAGSGGAFGGDLTNRVPRKTVGRAEDKPIVTAASGGGSIPVGIAVARQRHDPRPTDDPPTAPPPQPPPPLVNGAAVSPGGNTLSGHWPLPPTPCTPGIPSAPFWLPQSQFSGVGMDATVGGGMGLGYQFVRDHLGGHYYVLPHPHAIPDPSGHSLVWAGYGGVAAASPVVMAPHPQQLLLPDAFHHHRTIHPALVHVPHPHAPVQSPPTHTSIKREDPPTPVTPDEDPKGRSLSASMVAQAPPPQVAELNLPTQLQAGIRHLPAPFLYPPASTLPYYLPQPPHGTPFAIPPFTHPPSSTLGSSGLSSSTLANSLTTTITDTLTAQGNITTTFSVLPAAPVTSVAKSSGLEHCSSRGCESLVATASPVPRVDSNEPINVTSQSEEEPDIDLPLTKAPPPMTALTLPIPFKIKQEIKEEILSPMGIGREESGGIPGVTNNTPGNRLPANPMVTIKKEALISTEDRESVNDARSFNTAVYHSQITEPCSQSIPSVCTALLQPQIPGQNITVNLSHQSSTYDGSRVCQESLDLVDSHPQAIDFSMSQKRKSCEPPEAILNSEAEHIVSCKESQRSVSPPPCDRIISETHSSSKSLESSPGVTTISKALIVNSSSLKSVSADSRPLNIVHPVPQTLPNEETEKKEDNEDKESNSISVSPDSLQKENENEKESASLPKDDTQKVQQPAFLDLSGLELLSQSVLQHANRLSSVSPEHTSTSVSPLPSDKDTTDIASEATESQTKDSSVVQDSETGVAQKCSTEGLAKESSFEEEITPDSCSTIEDPNEDNLGNVESEDQIRGPENSQDEENQVCTENSNSIDTNEEKEELMVRDRMPELVQACMRELPSSPTSNKSSSQDSAEDSVVTNSMSLEEQEGTEQDTSPADSSMPDRISGLHGLSLLCALAEQHLMKEDHVTCPALSSLADIAATSPSVPTNTCPPKPLSPQPGSSSAPISIYGGPFGSLASNAIFGSTTFGVLPSTYTTPIKASDINRNYKSPESEREAKAFIANKASQYHKDSLDGFKNPSGFAIDSMDANELDMRMQLAELQRKYRETQKELSRLPAKKISASPAKRGPGRPPKRKVVNNDVPGKKKVGRPPLKRKSPQKELSPPILERVTDLDIKELSKDSDDDKETRNTNRSILKPPVLNRVFDENHTSLPKTFETQISTEKEESSDEDTDKEKTRRWSFSSEDTAPPSLGSPFKQPVATPETRLEESEEEQAKDIVQTDTVTQDLKVLSAETSVESSPSDLEQQSTSSSASKKRKPGRPKKHSPTKEDATETIVAKKPKTLNFLMHRPLLANKSKMRPKLKAEVKIREEEEEDTIPRSHYALSSNGELSSHALSEDEDDYKSNVRMGSVDIVRGARKRGCPRGRASFTRRAILRDKEKRKSAAEKQSHMEALYRSLKRHSTMAAAEHDESEEERDKEDRDIPHEFSPVRRIIASRLMDCSNSDHETSHKFVERDQVSSSASFVSTSTTTVTTTMSNVTATASTPSASSEASRPNIPTPEPSVCVIEINDLVDKARVLVLQDGLLYAGSVVPITPPDVYGVIIDGERGSRRHIYCREELLSQSWKEVKPGSSRFLVEGTRVCAFWSQQYRALYPGCIAASSSPAHEANHNFVNVEFDDGDSGKIHVDDIRLLPSEFPVIEYDPNPLNTLNKRKRRPTGDSHSSDYREEPGIRMKSKKIRTYSGTSVDNDYHMNNEDEENLDVEKENQESNVNINDEKENQNVVQNKKNDKRKHKKHKHTDPSHHHRHKHRNKHKHKHREGDRPLPHVEPGDNELTMRIKSPPPPLSESQRQRQPSFIQESDSEREEEEEEEKQEEEEEEQSSKSPTDDESEGNDSEYSPTKKESAKGPSRKKKRHPSGKSRIAPFLPERQLWRWSGKGFKRPGAKGKGKKEFFKAIVRGKEMIRVEDCAVFLSAGQPDRPYIGRIEHMWESWGGNMVVKVKWFYHPQETKGLGKRLTDPKGALFQSPHTDENDVQTISHKCDVIALSDYKVRRGELESKHGPNYENCDVYFLAGSYDPISGRITMEPGVS